MKICGVSNIGKIREENQDCYKAGMTADGTFWFVLCDGMGGMRTGGVASKTVVDFLEKRLIKGLPSLADNKIQDFIVSAVEKANTELYKKSVVGSTASMGTTLEAAVIRGGCCHTVHCGDSRIYKISKKHIVQLTKDHSMVQELVDCGKITEEEAKNHPNKNIITHALGIEEKTKLDYNCFRLSKGEMLLMCSDGLTNMVEDSEIAALTQNTDFYDLPQALVDMALERGGVDNITAVLAIQE